MPKSKSKNKQSTHKVSQPEVSPSLPEAPVKVAEKPPTPPEKTMSEKIWLDIQHVRLDLFGLPAQAIAKYCTPVIVEPSKLYLSFKIGAVLPAMEMALSSKYTVELFDKYLVVALKGKI